MPKGVYLRTALARRHIAEAKKGTTPWNKGLHQDGELIAKVNAVIASNVELLTVGELFTALVATGELDGCGRAYKRFIWHLKKARAAGSVDESRIAEGRGRLNRKFEVGAKVRINPHAFNLPVWLARQLRLDTPRTVTAAFRSQGHPIRYYLGTNGLGNEVLLSHPFQADELTPYIKGKRGRPRTKRPYRKATTNNRPAVVMDSPTTNRPDPCTAMVLVKNAPSISYVNQL